jgi:hypothetical protein
VSELERTRPAEVPNVITGELISLDDIPGLARYLRDIRAHEADLRTIKRMLEAEIIEHARRIGTKTLRMAGVEATIRGGPKIVWDTEKLERLLEAGLPKERFAELVTIEYVAKVNTQVARSISSSNPEYARIIEEARSEEPAPEHVSVSS